jgi:predicted dienelactone hydrolase
MRSFVLVLTLALASVALARPTPVAECVEHSGGEATRCLEAFLAGGSAEPAFTDAAVRDHCTDDVTYAMGALGVDDLLLVVRNACTDFGHDWLTVTTPPAPATPGQAACRTALASELTTLRQRTIELLGSTCSVPEAQGRRCRRPGREGRVQKLARAAERHIAQACGPVYDDLGLPPLDDVVATALERARHFAQVVYPPNDLGPTSDPGPFPVGVRTLELVDPTRTSVTGTGPRPVTVEIWYPTTPETVVGVPRYVVNLFGLDVARTPTYRDVDRAAGQYPLVLFSHGNGGIRFQSLFLAAHLASHGYIVASPDHQGNTFLDIGAGVIDAQVLTNRPKDMTFMLDTLLQRNATPGDFLAGAIDASRIGMSGHSFGGLDTFELAAGGTKDDRIGAFMPLAPANIFNEAFFQSITKPMLIQGGSIDTTTPFAANQETPFEFLPSGAPVVALAELVDAGHFTFSDICEVPRNLVGAIGGFGEACTPEHLAWRHAHDIVDFLALNFFDATLSGDRKALRRLRPRQLASIEDLIYRNK